MLRHLKRHILEFIWKRTSHVVDAGRKTVTTDELIEAGHKYYKLKIDRMKKFGHTYNEEELEGFKITIEKE